MQKVMSFDEDMEFAAIPDLQIKVEEEVLCKTIVALGALMQRLPTESQMLLDVDNPLHVYYLIELVLNQIEINFQVPGPVRTVFHRNGFMNELVQIAKKQNLPYEWNNEKVFNSKADQGFLGFLQALVERVQQLTKKKSDDKSLLETDTNK